MVLTPLRRVFTIKQLVLAAQKTILCGIRFVGRADLGKIALALTFHCAAVCIAQAGMGAVSILHAGVTQGIALEIGGV
jgi:hypothetical protein